MHTTDLVYGEEKKEKNIWPASLFLVVSRIRRFENYEWLWLRPQVGHGMPERRCRWSSSGLAAVCLVRMLQNARKSRLQQPSQVTGVTFFVVFILVLFWWPLFRLPCINSRTLDGWRTQRNLCVKWEDCTETVPFFYPEKSGSSGTENRYAWKIPWLQSLMARPTHSTMVHQSRLCTVFFFNPAAESYAIL